MSDETTTEKQSINWLLVGRGIWKDGIEKTMREQIVNVTSNRWDNLAVDLLGSLVDKLLPAADTE